MFVVPAPTMVIVFPLTVATAVFELVYVTALPEPPPVAVRLNAASPNVLAESAANVIV